MMPFLTTFRCFSYLHVLLLLSDVTHAFQDLLRLIVLRRVLLSPQPHLPRQVIPGASSWKSANGHRIEILNRYTALTLKDRIRPGHAESHTSPCSSYSRRRRSGQTQLVLEGEVDVVPLSCSVHWLRWHHQVGVLPHV